MLELQGSKPHWEIVMFFQFSFLPVLENVLAKCLS